MNIQKIKHFIHLVQKERTGSPTEVALKLGVSERMIYNYVNILKDVLNAPIDYNRHKKTFIFLKEGKLFWEWVCEEE